jgi:flagellar motor switch protein FliG
MGNLGRAVRAGSYESLNGRQKAALVCLALGADAAAKVTQRLSTDEVDMLSFEIARIDDVPTEVVDQILEEWIESAIGLGSLSSGGVEFAREVLEKAFGAGKANMILNRVQSQLNDTAGLTRLRRADPQQLGNTLRNEHPQTIALVLAHLDPQQTAGILKEIPASTGGEVVYRMAQMEKVQPEMLMLIEKHIGSDTSSMMAEGTASGGPKAVAEVMNFISGVLEKELLEGVESRDPELCEAIKNLMFVFEDLQGLDDKAIQRVLREVEAKSLALALKAASPELKQKILGCMSQRAVAALQEEMEMMGPARMKDVEAAQTAFVAQVRRLEEMGEIVIGGKGSDDVLV